jgi:hypothetical protein
MGIISHSTVIKGILNLILDFFFPSFEYTSHFYVHVIKSLFTCDRTSKFTYQVIVSVLDNNRQESNIVKHGCKPLAYYQYDLTFCHASIIKTIYGHHFTLYSN